MKIVNTIHPTAIIDKNLKIGKGNIIGPYTVIGPDVEIGDNNYIGPSCLIEYSKIGTGNKIIGHAFIGTEPQDYKYANEKTYVEIGDNNIIREGVSIHRGTPTGHKLTKIGSGCFFMANSHVGHDCVIGNNVIMVNSSACAGHVEVGDNTILSGLCGVHQFTRIGSFVMVGGGAMVNQDIIPYVIAQGDRAKPVGLNIVGLKRAGFDLASIKAIKEAFMILFKKGLKIEDAVKELEKINNDRVKNIVDFIKNSKRGIARPRKRTNYE